MKIIKDFEKILNEIENCDVYETTPTTMELNLDDWFGRLEDILSNVEALNDKYQQLRNKGEF